MKTTINDFRFNFSGHGHYKVIYRSPVTSKEWTRTISDMTLIDRTRNVDAPKLIDLNYLKKLCKESK